jgi:TetR/AcrR family transcriptional regulator, ethionamide resistance regulator
MDVRVAPPHPRRRGRPPKAESGPPIEARLLAAMHRLLARGQSFGAVSVDALSAEAGIARATFYVHYRDKAALVSQWLKQISDEVVTSGGRWFSDARGATPEDVRVALLGVLKTFQKHRTIFAAVADTAPFDADVDALHRDMMARLCAASRKAVATLRQEGRAHPKADDAMADLLTWLVEGYAARFVVGHDDPALGRIAEQLAHVCASALFDPALLAPVQGARSKRSRKP